MFVLHGVNDTLVPLVVARYFVDRLRQTSQEPVVYVELPRAQHAFDVLASIRCRHTTMGVVRFLDGIRARVVDPPAPGRPTVVGPNRTE
jgi:acetyl esterase/lipase